jgi:hypothetical protein
VENEDSSFLAVSSAVAVAVAMVGEARRETRAIAKVVLESFMVLIRKGFFGRLNCFVLQFAVCGFVSRVS